jgi:small subunit ribosomal protein S21|tara:strand:+ start:646 stop:978 length:333 start_codon:yes stop_codon:yes gene_type:complete
MNRNKNFKKRPFKGKRHRREDFFLPGCGLGVKVPDSDPGTLEKAMKYLKRQMKDDGTIMRLKDKRYYEKPSMRRRRELDAAKRWQWTLDRKAERADKGHVWTAIMNGKAG